MDQLPRLGKRELICLLLFTCNYVVSVWRGFLFLWVLGMGYVILLWHSLSLPYNYFKYRQTSICQTCLSRKPDLCRSDRPFPNFSPIFYCIWPCLCRTRLWRKFGCIEVIFHSREKFSISFTTGCVEVKMCTVIGSLMQKHILVIIPIRQ